VTYDSAAGIVDAGGWEHRSGHKEKLQGVTVRRLILK
jgi:hypothetical protein